MTALTIYGEGDARRIVSGGDDEVSVWDVVKGDEPLLKLDAGRVFAVTWYGEGDARRIASGGDSCSCGTPSRAARRCASSRTAGMPPLLSLTCHRAGDGWHIVSGGVDKTLHVFDAVEGGAPLRKLEGHTSYVTAIACHGEGDKRRYVSASRDKTVRVWDVAAGAAARPAVDGHEDIVFAPRASATGGAS